MITSLMRFRAQLACFALLCLPVTAFAAEITNIQVSTDNSSWLTHVSVAPGDTLYIRVSGTASGGAGKLGSIGWGINDLGTVPNCAAVAEQTSNFSNLVFSIVVPALAADNYDLNLQPRQGDACGAGAGAIQSLDDGITILGAAVCGNGIVEGAEACDDGNTVNGDCCSSTCQFEGSGSFCGGAGDGVCDLQDTCDGAGVCVDNVAAGGDTVTCGDDGTECTNQDYCDGAGSCTDNGFVAADTTCGGAGDGVCDLQDTCDGAGTCVDNVAAGGDTVTCGDDGTECTNQDFCDGAGSCTDNGFVVADTACGDAGDGVCDLQDTCDGAGTCVENLADAGVFCGDDGTECIVQDTCDGAGSCTDNGFFAAGTACGDGTVTECTDADTCDGGGVCLFNNVECGSVTTSGLCEFDEEPGKDGDQFRVAFSPDMQNWVSYKQNSTNPGQFYYNAIHDASAAGDGVTFELVIPYPFVTQGATPLHVYDADLVPSNGSGCLDPQEPLMAAQTVIGLADWLQGAGYVAPDYLVCNPTSLGETGDCVITVEVPQGVIDATANGWVYLNLHLDYGLKGPHVDADGDGDVDRYDRAGFISPWGSSDALFNTEDNTGDVAIADCSVHTFAHAVDTVPAFDDSIENLNVFKQAAGAFGRAYCGADDGALVGWVQLQKAGDGSPVFTTQIDEDGYYAASYAHKGKAIEYQIQYCDDAACTNPGDVTEPFFLQSNGFVQIDLEENAACDGESFAAIEPIYSKGKFKNAP